MTSAVPTMPAPPDEAPAVADPIRRHRRERRPSGAPPPLPRSIGRTGRIWLAAVAWVFLASVVAFRLPSWERLANRNDTWILDRLIALRTPWLTHVMRAVKVIGSGWGIPLLGITLVGLLMAFRRWRHLLAFLGSLFLVQVLGRVMYVVASRPRPYGVRSLSGWGGFALPSPPVATLALPLVGILYTLIPHGRIRNRAKWAAAAVLFLVACSRVYLAVDHPSDATFGAVLGVAISVTIFRLFTPWDVFPIVYRRGTTAHLDVTGRRTDAIRRAVAQQLGLEVLEIQPFGLEGSGGSTPLRLKVAGEPDTYVFAKLYAKSHVRADRWYKHWRTILNGTLEDEASFQTVRRFVEYEDYTLRVVWDAGIPTAKPYGIVEITPESEYLLVMGFQEGATEIGKADVDDDVIDQGLAIIRRLWDAGLAHRDIKPANLLVKDGKLLLIDVFFVQVRPSPWRQAVDLGNMMLVLACRTDAERVYRRALRFFSPDEIAEAFAATRGVASPTQLRSFLKRDRRDLIGQFRELAPQRDLIRIQRLSPRRIVTTVLMLGAFAVAILGGWQLFVPLQDPDVTSPPECGTGDPVILFAQSVPGATLVPCIASLPSGWRFGGAQAHSGRARFWLDSDVAGTHAVQVTLTPSCRVRPFDRVPTDEPGTQRYEIPTSLAPSLVDTRVYRFGGGCVTYLFRFAPRAPSSLMFDVDAAVSFERRATLVSFLRRNERAELCGAGGRCRG